MEEQEKEVKQEQFKSESVGNTNNKVVRWIRNPYNLALVSILIIAFAIRLYFFIITKNQPLWWDELAYGGLAKNFITHTWDNTQFILTETHIRPLMFPFIWSFFMLLGFGEVLNRFILVFIPSIISVYFIYLIGREIYDKKVGLISAAIFSVLWLVLFYSSRFLVHMLELALLTSSIYFFIKATKEGFNFKHFAISLFLLSLATLTRYQDGMTFFVYFIVLILARKLYLNKLKFWFASIIGLIPLLILFLINLINKGNILPALFSGDYLKPTTSNGAIAPFAFSLLNYIPVFLQPILLIFFIIGIAYIIFKLFIGYNLLAKSAKLRNELLLVLLLIVFLSFFIFYLRGAEDRWLFEILIILTIVSAAGIGFIGSFLGKHSKILGIVAVILILCIAGFYQIKFSGNLIDGKKESYLQMKQAFEWLKENTPKDAILAGSGIDAYAVYYADRKFLGVPDNASDFVDPKYDYFISHGFTTPPGYLQSYLDEYKESLQPIQVYYLDPQKTQPIVVIYKNLNSTTFR